MKHRKALTAAVLSAAMCGSAWADEAAEKALQKKVDEMQKQLDDLTKRMGDGSNRAGDELEARVAEIEKLTKKDKDGLFPYWGNGIKLDSANSAFKLHIGGRIQNDWTWFSHTADAEEALTPAGKPTTQIEAGEEFRRARLAIDGTIYNNVIFSAEYDFAGGAVATRDVWIGLKGMPWGGQIQAGNMKEPTGTEELTSDLLIPFLERSASNEAFAPDYATGFMASGPVCDMASWQLGMFRASGASGNQTGNARSGDYDFAGRVAGRPWVDDENKQYLALGIAYQSRSPLGDAVQVRSRPELHIAPRFVDTGSFAADRQQFVEADAAFVTGPFWAFGDFFQENVHETSASGGKSPSFNGWQLAAGYFLTGETKPYKTSNSSFDRVKPKSDFDGNGGTGAWELAARIDSLDLDDKNIEGGKLDTWTLGVSWYLNPNTRVMLDWVHAKQKDLGVSINGIEMRFQIDF